MKNNQTKSPFMMYGTPDKVYVNGKETPEGEKQICLDSLHKNASEVIAFTITHINGISKLYVKTIKGVFVENEIAKKRKFVDTYLKPMCQSLGVGVTNVEFVYENDSAEEFIIISKGAAKFFKCVTADSLTALVRDVMQGL